MDFSIYTAGMWVYVCLLLFMFIPFRQRKFNSSENSFIYNADSTTVATYGRIHIPCRIRHFVHLFFAIERPASTIVCTIIAMIRGRRRRRSAKRFKQCNATNHPPTSEGGNITTILDILLCTAPTTVRCFISWNNYLLPSLYRAKRQDLFQQCSGFTSP
jgi:hypothetical protein